MSKWREHTVAELQEARILLVEDGNHGEYRPRPDEFSDSGVAFVRAADMSGGCVLFHSASRINAMARSRIHKGIGAGGDVLLSHKGTVGKVAFAPLDCEPFVCSPQTTFWRSLDQEVIDRRYLYYYLCSDHFHRQLDSRKGETDMADYVSLTVQRTLRVRFPDVRHQRLIARILGTIDDKIELNRRMNETLETMARAIFKSWFVDFDPIDGIAPDGWTASTLGECMDRFGGEVQTGPFGSQLHASDYTKHGVPVVMPVNLSADRISVDGIARIREDDAQRLARHRLRAGEIIQSRRGDVERLALVTSREAGWLCGTGCLRIQVNAHHVTPHYLYCYLRYPSVRSWINQHSLGSTMPNVNTTIMRELPLRIPPNHQADERSATLLTLIQRRDHNYLENESLVTLRDAILPKLLSGEIQMSQVKASLQ